MADVERRPEDESTYREHLSRSERVWDRWSDWYRLSEQDFEPIRRELITDLDLQPGDRVLEIGCGPGVNFELIRDAIGPEGTLVAIDFSSEMVAKAIARRDEHGWENVHVERADATTADLGSGYDAVIATLSMSVMPDIPRTVANVHDALAPGGRLGLLDLQQVQSGPLRICNPFIRVFLRWYANWNPEGDVREAIQETFDKVDLLGTHMLGTVYTLRASKANP